LIWRHVGLAQDTRKRADLDLTVHGNNTAFGATAHDYVTSGLTIFLNTKALQRTHNGNPG